MRRQLTFIVMTLISLVMAGSILLTVQPASAALFDNAKNEACNGVAVGSSTTGCSDTTSTTSVSSILATALNLVSLVAGIIAVIMIIIAGVKYVTSQGESAAVSSAKDTIIYAVIGLVIVAFAQIIVKFVLKRTGR